MPLNMNSLIVGEMMTNCYLVYDNISLEGVVIDPGADTDIILEKIRECALNIKYIILTHGHPDHVSGAEAIHKATKAPVTIHENDVALLDDRFVPDLLFADKEYFMVGDFVIETMHTPGHTAGSSILISSGCMFAGDTLFYEECGRCDLPTGDFNAMLRSLKQIAELGGEFSVFPGHGRSSTLGHERTHNPYMLEAVGQ